MALNDKPGIKLQPSTTKVPTATNYIDIFDYSSQYAPEVHDEIANIYGNQSVAGLLYLLQSEGTFESDKYIWTEEGRMFTVYKDVTRSGNTFTKAGHNFRVGEIVTVADAAEKAQVLIDSITANTFTVKRYKTASLSKIGNSGITAFVSGSEFRKGTDGMVGSKSIDVTILENKPKISKDKFHINGSDMAQVTWIKTEGGGYVWWLKDQVATRQRWESTCELDQMKAQKAESGSEAELSGHGGTEGYWEAVRERGNTYQGAPAAIGDWDTIIKRFDQQGKIADYTYYCDRDASLAVDDMLGVLNAGFDKGLSYGLFPNGKDMAINLGFAGFTRGSYNIFKTDYKLLNDPTTEGAIPIEQRVRAMLIPAGTTPVYKGEYNGRSGSGQKIYVPNLQALYRANAYTNRKDQNWLAGNGLGIHTDTAGNDSLHQHFLREGMLNTIGANNHMLFEGQA